MHQGVQSAMGADLVYTFGHRTTAAVGSGRQGVPVLQSVPVNHLAESPEQKPPLSGVTTTTWLTSVVFFGPRMQHPKMGCDVRQYAQSTACSAKEVSHLEQADLQTGVA